MISKNITITTAMSIHSRLQKTLASFSLLLLIFISGPSNELFAQTKMGIQTGFNSSNVLMKDRSGNKNPSQSIPGFHIGVNANFPVAKNICIQPVLEYTQKGFRQSSNGFSGLNNEITVRTSYFQLPVNVIYEWNVQNAKLFVGAGPYIGYGNEGKWKSKYDVLLGDIRIENFGKVNFRNDFMDGSFGEYLYGKPWDYGANLLIGSQFFEHLKVQVSNQMGIRNLQPEIGDKAEGGFIKNRVWSFSAGYNF